MQFVDIIGHDRIKTILKRALLRQRISHAYIFSGSPGIGKSLLARAFVQLLQCDAPSFENNQPCNRCPGCRHIREATHPDVIHILPDGQFIKIEQIREVQRKTHFKPVMGQINAILIDEAHSLHPTAANALLKTLEEPSPDTVLLLITDKPHRLLTTIISRCQQLKFNPLPPERVIEYLGTHFDIEDTQGSILAALAEGSLGKAIQIHQEGWHLQWETFLDDFLVAQRGAASQKIGFCEKWSRDKHILLQLIDFMRIWQRDLLLLAEGVDPSHLVNRSKMPLLQQQTQHQPADFAWQNIATINAVHRDIESNVNPRLALENILFSYKQL